MTAIRVLPPRDEVHKSAWDDSANVYADVALKISFYRDISKELVVRAQVAEGMSIVDLGCGSACLTILDLLNACPRLGIIYGIDGSREMLRVASARVRSEKVVFLLAAAETFHSVLRYKVDRVLCNSALWLFESTSIAQVASSLSENGLFIFSYPEFEKTHHPKQAAINDELLAHGRKPLTTKRSTLIESKLRLEQMVSKNFSIEDVYRMKVVVSARDWSYFYQIPSVVRRLMPKLPLDLAMRILSNAMARLEGQSLPMSEWCIVTARPRRKRSEP